MGAKVALLGFALSVATVLAGSLSAQTPAGSRPVASAEQQPLASRHQRVLDTLAKGDRTIDSGSTVAGDAYARGGTLLVRGIVNGDAVTLDGDVVLAAGAHVIGNAIAMNGRVRDDGGIIDGEMRVLRSAAPVTPPLSNWARTQRALKAVGGVFGVGLLIALVVLMSAQGPLEAVARAAERDVSASFWVGVLWQLLAVPILCVVIILLTVTVIGILAWPIAILAWVLALAGSVTLGLFAVLLLMGRVFLRRDRSVHERSALLWSLVIGLSLLATVWIAAAALVSVPAAGVTVRVGALALSWVAATVGLGAVVRSRGGTLREHTEKTVEIPSWQTPTPIGGVVAARRPTPVGSAPIE